MFKPVALVLAGAVLTAGAAHAQEAAAPRLTAPSVETSTAGTPWYQRFTTSSGVTEAVTGGIENDRSSPAWTMNQRWGVTLDIRRPPGLTACPKAAAATRLCALALHLRVRVGGEVSLDPPSAPARPWLSATRMRPAGVRVESAFRFGAASAPPKSPAVPRP